MYHQQILKDLLKLRIKRGLKFQRKVHEKILPIILEDSGLPLDEIKVTTQAVY
jgi:hypothetical protein